ncbi:hypothetical protein M1N54_00260, partial [Thermodesulfovibrionales bacterium]|nr:hypothetical protein [Thermodesulfovibrionales bacterium]
RSYPHKIARSQKIGVTAYIETVMRYIIWKLETGNCFYNRDRVGVNYYISYRFLVSQLGALAKVIVLMYNIMSLSLGCCRLHIIPVYLCQALDDPNSNCNSKERRLSNEFRIF